MLRNKVDVCLPSILDLELKAHNLFQQVASHKLLLMRLLERREVRRGMRHGMRRVSRRGFAILFASAPKRGGGRRRGRARRARGSEGRGSEESRMGGVGDKGRSGTGAAETEGVPWKTARGRQGARRVLRKRKTPLERGACESMVPGVGLEPTHLAVSVFETDASAIPPPGRVTKYYRPSWRILEGKNSKPPIRGRKPPGTNGPRPSIAGRFRPKEREGLDRRRRREAWG